MTSRSRQPRTHLSEGEFQLLLWLGSMPLLSPPELITLADWSRATLYRAVNRLDRRGLVSSLYTSTPGMNPARRLYLTPSGIDALASGLDVSTAAVMAGHPVSGHWLRLLLSRLDAVASIYRLMAQVSEVTPLQAFRWYRKLPIDAGVELSGGRLGIIREGRMAPPSHLESRLKGLLGIPHPDTQFIIAPDSLRVSGWRRLLGRMPFTACLAEERKLLEGNLDSPIWYTSFDPGPMSLRAALRFVRGGPLPSERVPRRSGVLPPDLQVRAARMAQSGVYSPSDRYLFPVALKASQKRALEVVALWPLITLDDLAHMLGISKVGAFQALESPTRLRLVRRLRLDGRFRYALSDAGLSVFTRRDRLAVPRVLRAWSASLLDPASPCSWSNLHGSRLRQLARQLAHTSSVHRFLARMASDARTLGHNLAVMEPPHRAQRRYRSGGHAFVLTPDAYGRYERQEGVFHFFLEWEQRAANAVQFKEKLTPYIRYYRTRQPLEDFGCYPTIMFVLRDELPEAHFIEVATRLEESDGLEVAPLVATHVSLVEARGPLSPIWSDGQGVSKMITLDALSPRPVGTNT